MGFVDLHLHTNHSDGIVTPEEVIKIAMSNGVTTVSVTDHDNIDGLNESFEAVKGTSVKIISGVEVSTNWYGKVIHILVYGFDIKDAAFTDFLDQQYRKRKSYFIKKIEVLAPGLVDEFLLENGSYFNMVKAREFLVKKGIFSDLKTAGDAMRAVAIKDGFVDPEEVIGAAHRAGALAVLAHPFAPKISLKKISLVPLEQKRLVAELVSQKVDGIECYQAGHSLEDTNFALEIAKEHGLLVSGGSDWHGPIETLGEDMREYIPYYTVPGGLQTPESAAAPLLARLGVVVGK